MAYPLQETGRTRQTGVVVLMVMIGLGLALCIEGISLSADSFRTWPLGACLMTGAGLIVLSLAARTFMAALAVGTPRLTVSAPNVYPGVPFSLHCVRAARRSADFGAVTLRLVFRETVFHGEGEDETRTVADEKIVWSDVFLGGRQHAGETFERDFTLSVPPDGMPTFAANHHKLQWFLQVATRLPGWSDFATEFELIVSPGAPLVLMPEPTETLQKSPARVRILIAQDGPDGIAEGTPRGVLAGMVEVTPTNDLYCHLHVRVGWHTEGKGDRDSQCIRDAYLHQGDLRGGEHANFPFHVWLPQEPISYTGRCVRIVWAMTVELSDPQPGGTKTEYRFLLGPSILASSPSESLPTGPPRIGG